MLSVAGPLSIFGAEVLEWSLQAVGRDWGCRAAFALNINLLFLRNPWQSFQGIPFHFCNLLVLLSSYPSYLFLEPPKTFPDRGLNAISFPDWRFCHLHMAVSLCHLGFISTVTSPDIFLPTPVTLPPRPGIIFLVLVCV